MSERRRLFVLALLLSWVALAPIVALAQQQGGLPWEKPLTDISTSMIGPVALAGFFVALVIMCLTAMMGYSILGMVVGIVVFGAILGNADSIAGWLGLG